MIILFSIANVDNVTFSFLVGKVRLPLILVIIGGILIGALLVGLFTYGKIYRQQRRIRILERQLNNRDLSTDADNNSVPDEDAVADEAVTEDSRYARRRRLK
nr:lipopolysaccharide assembly protein LapA domain-containing protein [Sporolactobacillus spathodeae]